jgi:KDO2-lipid IV(A) lauroyltransferase
VWENIGRVVAEFPHIHWLINNRVEVIDGDYCRALKDDGKPGIFISAHYGNWELAGAQGCHYGIPMILVYRAANNPYVERLYQKGRAASATGGQIAKGQQGARDILTVLRKGGHLGMLVDQKMNDGIAVPFFGRDAMTAPAVGRMSIKYQCPVVPAKVERLKGAHFRITFYPPLDLPNTGDAAADTLDVMTRINALVESWIRQDPGQWLWLHRRWPRD